LGRSGERYHGRDDLQGQDDRRDTWQKNDPDTALKMTILATA